jgi:hypothetical protein
MNAKQSMVWAVVASVAGVIATGQATAGDLASFKVQVPLDQTWTDEWLT